MPRLKLSCLSPLGVEGPCVTISGQVMSGAGSPGQQVWTGSVPRSMSSPVSTISRQARAMPTVLRLHRHHGAQHGQHVERLAPAAGRLGLAQEGQRLADARATRGAPRSMPQATRSTVPKRLTSTGIVRSACRRHRTTFSNSTAGPLLGQQAGSGSRSSPRCGDTGAVTRTSRPALFQPGDEIAQARRRASWGCPFRVGERMRSNATLAGGVRGSAERAQESGCWPARMPCAARSANPADAFPGGATISWIAPRPSACGARC